MVLVIYGIPVTWGVGPRPLSFNNLETGQLGHMGEISEWLPIFRKVTTCGVNEPGRNLEV